MRFPLPSAAPDAPELTPALDALLDRLARAAQAGDAGARNELYARLAGLTARLSHRARRGVDDLDLAEIDSEAYLALADLVRDWNGDCFGRYFLGAFPGRLRRRLLASRRGRSGATDAVLLARVASARLDDDLAATLHRWLIEADVRLEPADWAVLRWRLLGDDVERLAAATGLSRRTLYRRWHDLAARLRAARGLREHHAASPGAHGEACQNGGPISAYPRTQGSSDRASDSPAPRKDRDEELR